MKTTILITVLLGFSIITTAQVKPSISNTEKGTMNSLRLDPDSDNDGLGDVAMNKGELVDAIAKEAGLTKADAGKALNAFVSNVSQSLKKGDNVQLIGFGTFSISNRAARTGRNPQTGAAIKLAAKKVVKFKACPELTDIVKNAPQTKILDERKGRLLTETKRAVDIDSDDDGLVDSLNNIERCDGVDQDCNSQTDDELKKGMNKAELIESIAKDAGLSKADAGKALNAFVSNVSESLKKGNNVQLIGFGTFSVSNSVAHSCKDPKTGEIKKIAAKKVAKFKAGKALADTVK